MNISAVHADDVWKIWPAVRTGCQLLLEKHGTGRWTVEDVYANLLEGEWQLFTISSDQEIIACLVCSILEGDRKTFEIGLCWGRDASIWASDVGDAFDQIGREMGCDQLALDGRPGWRKIMREQGFELKSVTYTRSLNGQH